MSLKQSRLKPWGVFSKHRLWLFRGKKRTERAMRRLMLTTKLLKTDTTTPRQISSTPLIPESEEELREASSAQRVNPVPYW